ncbi:putative GMC oxidoreductase [Annulohypoxylon maeteangense]|uniref:putative GMC oxidoreductase n=1 Tax=Annulohypoxylon maeteangense TaxID=1927788 RepID=UPI0020077B53|nr:putative GMC oxidoreductase [Annulohypoxylon maeteangense]KAI0879846.1 putative GMC oxidoreductase [Annulohypoxylon maeteangense]
MPSNTYDFIVIGGGTAGLVVATRLSEEPSQRVLVLEAGSDLSSDHRIKTPASWTSLQGTEADWGFKTEAQTLLNGRSIGVSQGKVLGGSSSINAQVFVPCNPSVIDHWGSSLGNSGWSWETLRPYYAKAYTSPPVDSSLTETLGIDGWSDHSSTHGPLPTSFPGNPFHPIRKAWADTFRANGYYNAQDPFINGSLGSFSCLATVDPVTKERTNAASAYYHPNKTRKNLVVLTNSTAEKILLDSESHDSEKPAAATGVLYRYNGEYRQATCNKEVIIAAGALQSPKILELSGIGNANVLEKHGIDPIINLPGVGENLYDHLIDTISYLAVDELETLDPLISDPSVREQAAKDFAERRTGLLSSMGVYTYAYLPIMEHLSSEGRERLTKLLFDNCPASGKEPDQVRARAYYQVAKATLLDPKQASGTYLSFLGPWGGPIEGNSRTLTLGAMLSQPLSRGSVHISSKDTSAAPIVNPNYLSNPLDLDLYAEHMLYIETIARSHPLTDLIKHPITHQDPSSTLTDLGTARKWIQKSAASMWHLGGSCAMLPKNMNGVVDSTLKVYGTRNLRIVDSSAIPLISTANLQSTVYAFAERAADLIKETWSLT